MIKHTMKTIGDKHSMVSFFANTFKIILTDINNLNSNADNLDEINLERIMKINQSLDLDLANLIYDIQEKLKNNQKTEEFYEKIALLYMDFFEYYENSVFGDIIETRRNSANGDNIVYKNNFLLYLDITDACSKIILDELKKYEIDMNEYLPKAMGIMHSAVSNYRKYTILPVFTKEKVKEAFNFYVIEKPEYVDYTNLTQEQIICVMMLNCRVDDRLILKFGIKPKQLGSLLRLHDLCEDEEVIAGRIELEKREFWV